MTPLEEFIEGWTEDQLNIRPIFMSLYRRLGAMAGTDVSFQARPGITYSLRAAYQGQAERPLFVMVDVIDDDPRQRWLSVCFYEDMVSDPEAHGDLIPEGLLGDDGYCFDISESDPHMATYVEARVSEAHAAAMR